MTKENLINWGQIVTNSLSMLVASVFVGAAYIVWTAATTLDQRIDQANDGLEETQQRTNGVVDILIGELADIQTTVDSNAAELVRLREALQKSIASSRDDTGTPPELREWAEVALPNELQIERRQQTLDRLTKEVAPYKQQTIRTDDR